MSSSSDRVPFYINENGIPRIATNEELEAFKANPKNKAIITKWLKANRIAEANYHLKQGELQNVAWAKAFDRYPDLDQKPRFYIK